MRCVKQERLYRATDWDLGSTKDIDFGAVKPHPTLKKHILGVRVIISGSMTQSADTALLAKERMWGILDTIAISAPGLNLQKGIINGEDLFILGHAIGFHTSLNANIIVAADLAKDTNPHTFIQEYVYPFANGYYEGTPIDDDAAIQGALPSEAFGAAANLSVAIVGAGGTMGVWVVTAQTDLTIYAIADVLLTDELLLPGVPLIEATTTSENTIKSTEVSKSAFHAALVTDDAYDAFTIATGDCDCYVDDTQLFSGVTGQALMNGADQRRAAQGRENIEKLVDNKYTLMVDPMQCKTPLTSPTGSQVRSQNIGAQNGASRFICRRFVTPTPSEAAILLAAQGLPANIGPERLFYRGQPATLVGDREAQHGVTWVVR